MNIHSLHHYLTNLSESEEHYRSGHPFSVWNQLPKVQIHGREMYRMFPDNLIFSSMHGENPVSGQNFDIPVGLQDISIKRNSRFNPVPEHVHSHIEINYVYSGTCPQYIDGKPVLLKKDQVLLIDTDCPHSIDALGENDIMISMLIRKEFLPVFSTKHGRVMVSRIGIPDDIFFTNSPSTGLFTVTRYSFSW